MNSGYSDQDRARSKRRMRRPVRIVVLLVVVGIPLFFGLGHLVVWLWRETLVDIFAIKPISFWQAWGLILLAQIFFKANMQSTTRTRRRWQRDDAAGDPPPAVPEGERS